MSKILTIKEFRKQIIDMAKKCGLPKEIALAYVGLPMRKEKK